NGASGGALADDQIELKILHGRIEDLLDRRIETMDLVDEENVAFFEIGQQGRQIARLGYDGSGGGAKADAELLREDLRECGLAEPRRPGEQDVIECIAARPRSLDEHSQVCSCLLLADELIERLRADRRLEGIRFALRACDEAVRHCTCPRSCS